MNICVTEFETLEELNEFVNKSVHNKDIINIQFLGGLYLIYYWD